MIANGFDNQNRPKCQYMNTLRNLQFKNIQISCFTNKEIRIEHAFHSFACKSFSFDTIKVRVFGNTALLNILNHQEAKINGKDWSGDALLKDVWVK